MFIVGLDIGYSNLKMLSGVPGAPPAAAVLPAGAGPVAAMPDRFGRKPGGADGFLAVSVDGEAWAAGVEPSRLQNWERELHPDYPGTQSYRALFYAALALTGRAEIDHLVTGLPVSQYVNQQRRAALKALLEGDHAVAARRRVRVKRVVVLPQPAGAYLDAVQKVDDPAAFDDARTLVIDPGFFSVDWVLIDGGEIRTANSGSSTNAMSVLLEAAGELIMAERGGHIGRDLLEKAVRAGQRTLSLFGRPVDLTRYVAQAAKRTAPVALTALRQSLRGESREVDIVVLAGGGAATYAEATREVFPKARLIVPSEPVLANVRGFWGYAT